MLCAACTEGIDEVSTTAEFDTFSATVNTTRTDMGDDYSVLWNEGDLVTIFNKTTDNLQYEAVNVNGSSTDLQHKSGVRGNKTLDHNYAIYPYDATATLSGEVLSTSIAAEQTFVADSDLHHAVMVAKSAETSLNFSNATSLLRCHLNTIIGGTTLKSIKVVSASNDIAGKVTIDMANGAVAEVVDGEGVKEIVLNCGDVELPTSGYTIFNIALAAGTFPADDLKYIYTVNIDGVERDFVYPIKKEVTFEAGAFRQTKFTFSESFDGNTSEAISYAEAITEVLNSGQDVTLEKDVVLTEPLAITGTATLNLNGKTISANFTDKDNEAVIYNTGSLTLAGNGTISNSAVNGAAVISNSGNLVLDGVTVQGAPIGETGYPAYAITTSGSLTVEDGTTVVSDRGAISLSNGADVTINGGDITVTNAVGTRVLTSHVIYAYNSSSKLTIYDGNFTQNIVAAGGTGASVICPAGATIEIYGGNFSYAGTVGQSACIQNYMGYGAPVDVYGGTFSDNSVSKNLADGYKAVAGNGKYVVMPDDVTGASTSTELSDAIASGSDVMLVGDITYNNNNISNDATIDLNGNTFEATNTITLGNNSNLTMTGGDYVVNSTYGHIDVRPSSAEGSVVTYEDVNFAFNKLNKTNGTCTNRLGSVVEVCATATDAKTVIKFKNCTFDNALILFEGMSGKTGIFEAEFDGCTFNALTSSAPIEVMNYVKGTIKLTNCTFNLECTSSSASAVSVSSSTSTAVTVTAENNTLNATAATPYTYDASKGETEVHNIKVFGTPNNIKLISMIGSTTSSATETGTKKSGIAAL